MTSECQSCVNDVTEVTRPLGGCAAGVLMAVVEPHCCNCWRGKKKFRIRRERKALLCAAERESPAEVSTHVSCGSKQGKKFC